MALKVWLPLNGDLENKGCSNIEVVNNGTTLDNNGKIGKCYYFNGSSSLAIPAVVLPSQTPEWSFSCWFSLANVTSTAAACLFSERTSGTYTGYTIFIYPNSGQMLIDDGVRWSITPMTFSANTWYHLVITRNPNGKFLYIDGILKKSTSTVGNTTAINTNGCLIGLAQSNSNLSSGNQGFLGKLNDVRIYDHCLSAAEVKEIAQGLVLHYKLDGFMGGTNSNLAQGSKNLTITSATTNCNISKRGAAVLETRTDGFTQIKGTAAWQGFSLWSDSLNLKVGTTYTYSFYGYTALDTSTNADISFYPMMYNSAGTRDTSSKMPISVMGDAFTNANARQIGKLSTTPQLYWASFTWNQTMADILTNGGKIELSIQIHGTFNTGRTDYLWAPKLEVGEKPTDWTPSIEEMGIDITKIKDSSGYNHNGTTLNTVEVSSDAPRYNTSTNLVNGNSMINCGRGGMVTDSITVNLWIKSSAWANPVSCTEGGGWNFEATGDYFKFPVYLASVGYKYGQTTHTRAQVCDNQWHMLTGIYDRLNQKVQVYVDGELDNEVSTGSSNNIAYNGSNVIWLGAEATGSATAASNGMAGLFSDFRIYCTALLDTDIKQLYNVGMKVDNLGEIHTYELEESGSKELIAGHPLNTNYSIHNEDRDWYNGYVNGEIYLNANMTSVGTGYIPVSPTGKTYYYDIDYSVNAGNQLYIQVERYDANKTARTNSAAVTILSTKPSSDVSHKHIFGTVDLSTDGVNPCAFISLRILNGWNGTASGTIGISTIHKISIKEVSSFQNPKTHKNGVLLLDELKEYQKPSFYKNGYIEATQFIER